MSTTTAKGNGSNGDGGALIPTFYVPQQATETRRQYDTFMVIRYEGAPLPEDTGIRPLPANTVFWESPDVWTEGSLGVNQPVPGEENTVFARITNRGLEQANGAFVRFWWADPSIAISAASVNPITSADSGNVGFAGVVPSGSSVVVKCPSPWVPIVENEGHECLLAEVTVPHRPDLPDGSLDPVLDRHVGQKNEQLVIAKPGGTFGLRLNAANLAPLRATVAFDVAPVLSDAVPSLLTRRTQLERRRLRGPTSVLPLTLRVTGHGERSIAPDDLFARRLLATGAAQLSGGCLPVPWISKSHELDPWESVKVEVEGEVPRSAAAGQTFMFRVVQRTGPMVIGGYTVVVLVE